MKRKNKLYKSISFDDIRRVYQKQIRINTKNKLKIRRFEDFYSINLARVKKLLIIKVIGRENIIYF